MKIIENNAGRQQAERFVWCPNCKSKLAITDADIRLTAGVHAVYCPCCHTHFAAMTEAETVAAYYQK